MTQPEAHPLPSEPDLAALLEDELTEPPDPAIWEGAMRCDICGYIEVHAKHAAKPPEPERDETVNLPFPTTDASKWAAEFVRLYPEADESLMLSWFANAIEHGRGPDTPTVPALDVGLLALALSEYEDGDARRPSPRLMARLLVEAERLASIYARDRSAPEPARDER